MKIEIRPIPNRNRIREFSEELEHFSQAHVLAPLVDPVTRRYVTGLSDADRKGLRDRGFPYDTDDTYVRGVPHPFWESQLVKVELKNSPVFLFPDKSDIDFVKWKYLQKSGYVYSSEEEMNEGGKPQATHYIYDEQVSTGVRASALQRRNDLLATRPPTPRARTTCWCGLRTSSTTGTTAPILSSCWGKGRRRWR